VSHKEPTVVDVYRRIKKAHEAGRGIRLSSDEVFLMWVMDDAVSQAVRSADEYEEGKINAERSV